MAKCTKQQPVVAEASRVVEYACMRTEAAAAAAGVDVERGLSEEEVRRRQPRVGPDAMERGEATSWRLVRRQLRSGLTILLLAVAALSAFLGEGQHSLLIVALVLVNGALGFWQEHRAERALEELRQMVRAQARVRREGRLRSVPSDQLVPGDVVVVQAGDIAPADLRLVAAEAMTANQASLTGESSPVDKTTAAVASVSTPATLRNTLFAGTMVMSGSGVGVVAATGGETCCGQAASLLRGLEQPGPLQVQLDRFASTLLAIGAVALLLVVGLNTWAGRSLVSSLPFGLALVVGIVPEALPAVTAITLAVGAADLARHRVIVKRLSALQDLSAVTVLCTDKTGTLTCGKMEVLTTWGAPDTLQKAVLATTYPERGRDAIYDAIIEHAGQRGGLQEVSLQPALKRLPFDPQRKRASTVIEREGRAWMIVLGAPANILEATADYRAVGGREQVQEEIQKLAGRGLRVIALSEKALPLRRDYSVADETGLSFLGLIGMGDPIRPGVKEAISQIQGLGVAVKLLTGDNLPTAQSVARQLGLACDGAAVMTGEQLRQAISPQQLRAVQVFAELVPEDKHLIVARLQAAGEAVAVTGDGINDAPALRTAAVGVAMGGGTDVAKAAGDVILIGDSLASLVVGTRKGRETLASLSKYLLYTMPGNLSLLITMLFASLALPFLPLRPEQVLLLALVTDLPLVAIATDAVDAEDVATPRRLDIRRLVALAGVLGILGAIFNLGLMLALQSAPQPVFRTAFFYELALTTFLLAPVVRSRHPFWRQERMGRPLLLALAIVTAGVVLLIATGTPLSQLLELAPLSLHINLAIVGYSLLYALVAQAASAIYYSMTAVDEKKLSTRGAAEQLLADDGGIDLP